MYKIELKEYIKAYKLLNGFPKTSSVYKDKAKVKQRAKILI
jgi:hypothetical protein